MLWVIAWSEKNKLVEDNWDAACLQECGELGGGLGKHLLVSGEGADVLRAGLRHRQISRSRGATNFGFGRRVEWENVAEFQLKSAMHLRRIFLWSSAGSVLPPTFFCPFVFDMRIVQCTPHRMIVARVKKQTHEEFVIFENYHNSFNRPGSVSEKCACWQALCGSSAHEWICSACWFVSIWYLASLGIFGQASNSWAAVRSSVHPIAHWFWGQGRGGGWGGEGVHAWRTVFAQSDSLIPLLVVCDW